METTFIDIESIQNKEEFERIKKTAICSICQGLIYQPKQCSKCENCFCKHCIDEWLKRNSTCPFRCPNATFKESRLIKNLLEKLNIKCPFGCDDIINYLDIDKHKQECIKTSFKQKCIDYEKKIKEFDDKTKQLEKKNKELEDKIKSFENKNSDTASKNKIQELENTIKNLEKQLQSNSNNNFPSQLKKWQKKSTLHNHPLILCTTKRANSWFCDNCHKFFDNSHYSYLCTLCDFDLCEKCFK